MIATANGHDIILIDQFFHDGRAALRQTLGVHDDQLYLTAQDAAGLVEFFRSDIHRFTHGLATYDRSWSRKRSQTAEANRTVTLQHHLFLFTHIGDCAGDVNLTQLDKITGAGKIRLAGLIGGREDNRSHSAVLSGFLILHDGDRRIRELVPEFIINARISRIVVSSIWEGDRTQRPFKGNIFQSGDNGIRVGAAGIFNRLGDNHNGVVRFKGV